MRLKVLLLHTQMFYHAKISIQFCAIKSMVKLHDRNRQSFISIQFCAIKSGQAVGGATQGVRFQFNFVRLKD